MGGIPGVEYERELKRLLEGDPGALRKSSRSCDEITRAKFTSIQKAPFLVLRAAGSLGSDLIAIEGDLALPIEVKSSKEAVFRFNTEYLRDQAKRMMEHCRASRLLPIYAYRLKGARGGAWRLFTRTVEFELVGRARVLARMLPALTFTTRGNMQMVWYDGLPLHDLFHLLTNDA